MRRPPVFQGKGDSNSTQKDAGQQEEDSPEPSNGVDLRIPPGFRLEPTWGGAMERNRFGEWGDQEWRRLMICLRSD